MKLKSIANADAVVQQAAALVAVEARAAVASRGVFVMAVSGGHTPWRLVRLFLPDLRGYRPCHGQQARFAADPHWRDLILFSEYFHGDNGRGCGANHQTGWTALVAQLLRKFGSGRSLSVAGAMQSAMAGTT